MTAYDAERLMAEIRRLAAEHRRLTGQSLLQTNEIAISDAIRLLRLNVPNEPLPGVDAVGAEERAGQLIQVKGRVIYPNAQAKQRVGQLGLDGRWTHMVLVLMDENYQPKELIEANREALTAALADIKPNKRGAMTVARFRNLGRVVWQAEKQAA